MTHRVSLPVQQVQSLFGRELRAMTLGLVLVVSVVVLLAVVLLLLLLILLKEETNQKKSRYLLLHIVDILQTIMNTSYPVLR